MMITIVNKIRIAGANNNQNLNESCAQLKGSLQNKNITNSGKSPKGGGGISTENQKVHNPKCILF